MKKLLLMTAVCCLGLAAASAQETDVNQYGQVVNVTPLNAEMQDGILVIKSKDSAYKVWFDIRVQGDAAVYFGQNKDYDPIGNGMSGYTYVPLLMDISLVYDR